MSKIKEGDNIGFRSTWAEVNLSNLGYNFNVIKGLVSKNKILVCVKADAYGHGIIPVSQKLAECGVDWLGVASIDEGIKIRESRINIPVLVLGVILPEHLGPLFKYNLTPTICSLEAAAQLNKKAASIGKCINIHIKVDTGMGRIGVLYKDAEIVIRKIADMKSLKIEGLFTHLSSADVNKSYTLRQLNMFSRLIASLKAAGIHISLLHAANSIGVIEYKDSHLNMVRPGLAVYGLYPKPGIKIRFKPVLSLKTRVVFVKEMPKGYGVSYGRTYITKKDTIIITLPIGYGDGYPRNLSNIGPVLVKGRRFTISGRVCMDQVMVDVKNLPVKVGEEVVMIGKQGKNMITVEELAKLSSTIPYEIVCGLGSRIPRIYPAA